ncbi:MAG: formate--tetrahydrofolate ligase [Alphaproteobacteria bacterium]|nr:formate--tetrahydrofolate ligase [Alphaproteobacteria bacterium]
MTTALDDITLARQTPLADIETIAAKVGLSAKDLYLYGPHKAKIVMDKVTSLQSQPPRGKLVLVTAISPTQAGEGKTTTTIGLGDALTQLQQKTMIALREPSLGPCLGLKGGATGGGHAQVAPMDEINLHFTGDFHAITSANALLAAMIDNHIYWSNAAGLDPSKIFWKRAIDMNDRALRHTLAALGNNGQVREDGFDITVASEVMAVFCLAQSYKDLEERLARMVIAQRFDKSFAKTSDVKAERAMAALLRDALQPNLVQTLEGTPALIHGGPFANIAHGCNSVIATQTALRLADYVVTEAGFGADLGAEKFFNIKCRAAGLAPCAAVVVATVRALKMHAGIAKEDLARENVKAVKDGLANLIRHVENVQKFGLPVLVAINKFSSDTQAEMNVIKEACEKIGIAAHFCTHWADGGKGALSLAQDLIKITQTPASFKLLYPDAMPLAEKIETVAKAIYRAENIHFESSATRKLALYEKEGFGKLPVCIAKTPYSFSDNQALRGAPDGFTLTVRDVRLSAGAGFVVALCGDILTMPGLPRSPAAERIHLNESGLIEGLF